MPVIAIQRDLFSEMENEYKLKAIGIDPSIIPPSTASLSHLPSGSVIAIKKTTIPEINAVIEDQ
jgi:hypothetical protein